jgi:hypothetical protein
MSAAPQQSKFKYVAEKAVRLDLAPAVDEAAAKEPAGLLDLLRCWLRARPEDRRLMPRHEAAGHPVWLGWWRGKEAYFSNPARLLNLSRGGALLLVKDPPPEGQAVWLCVGEPEPTDCVEARVLEVRSARRRECQVRLEFREPCPHAFFESAICMIAPTRPRRGSKAASEDAGFAS